MKTKIIFLSFFVLLFFLTSCGQATATPLPVTMMSVVTQQPTDIPTQTSIPFPAMPPYPTASVVKANAVVFVEREYWTGNLSLWIVNVDGSGERKLTDIENNESQSSNYLLQWSPNGKWIGYIAAGDLWIISPDGSAKRKILSIQGTDKKIIRRYAWSPDSTQIAYTLAPNRGDFTELKTGLLDLTTEKDSELFVYQSPANIVLSWSPDGRYILLNTTTSMKVFEVATGKTLAIESACPISHGEPSWSPNSEWFYRADYGTGYYYIWVCVNGLNGTSWQAIDGVIPPPVWDKTGDYLYFVDGEMNLDIGTNWFTNQRLVRYNVKARKIEDLLSLEEDGPTAYPPIVFLSPDGKKLGLYSYTYHEEDNLLLKQNEFIVLDIHSLSMVKYPLDLQGEIKSQLPPSMWSNDNEHIIFFFRDLVRQSYGISYSDSGSFYSLNIKTGEVYKFSGVHAVENAVISPIATSP